MRQEVIDRLKESLSDRNISFNYYDNRDRLMEDLIELTNSFDTIGIGNSKTLKVLGVSELMKEMGKNVLDKTQASTKEESKRIKREALLSDCYISSCNAISLEGEIINIDHSGNRVAAITYGPERVIIVVGKNKLADNEKDGINRALTIATPLNARRANIKSPCSLGKGCVECSPETRVCNYISIMRGQTKKGRMYVMMVNEELGF